jgi:hypothetical protein
MQTTDILFQYDLSRPSSSQDVKRAVDHFVQRLSIERLQRALDFYAFVYKEGALFTEIRDIYVRGYLAGDSRFLTIYDFFSGAVPDAEWRHLSTPSSVRNLQIDTKRLLLKVLVRLYAFNEGKSFEAVTFDDIVPVVKRMHYENSAHDFVRLSAGDLTDKIQRMEQAVGSRLSDIEARLAGVERLTSSKRDRSMDRVADRGRTSRSSSMRSSSPMSVASTTRLRAALAAMRGRQAS